MPPDFGVFIMRVITHLEYTDPNGKGFYACNLAVNYNPIKTVSTRKALTCKNCIRLFSNKIFCDECKKEIVTSPKHSHYILGSKLYHVACYHEKVKK